MTTWRDKDPSDMTLDELREAKHYLRGEFDGIAGRYNDLQVAIAHVDYEIGQRYELSGAPVGNRAGLADYPRERLFGDEQPPEG